MDLLNVSLADVLNSDVGCTNVVDLFEAPISDTKPTTSSCLQRHTIFRVDTTLTRKNRTRKLSERMKECKHKAGIRRGGPHVATVWFRRLNPELDCEDSMLPDDLEQLDAEECDEVQLFYERVSLLSVWADSRLGTLLYRM